MLWCTLLFLGGGVSTGLDAQVIQGRVLDADSDAAVGGATIELVDASDRVVRRVASGGADGAFTITAPQSGRFALRGRHIGYATTTSGLLALNAGDTVRVEFRISVEAIALPPLTVVGTPAPRVDPRLDAWGFYQRQRDYEGQGKAKFFTTEDLDASRATRISHLLRDLSELRLVDAGAGRVEVRTRRSNRPIPIFLNGSPTRSITPDNIVALGLVGAIEVYWRDAPAQYRHGFMDAAIVIWTR